MESLQQLRKAVELTQRQLSKLAGINRAYLAQIEAGIHKPSQVLETWLRHVMMSHHLSQQNLIIRLTDHGGPSEETARVLEELNRLKEEDISKLVKTRVVVWSLHSNVDWQIMSGLAALHLYRLFPNSLGLRFQ